MANANVVDDAFVDKGKGGVDIFEVEAWSVDGFVALIVAILLAVAGTLWPARAEGETLPVVVGVILWIVAALLLSGLVVVAPGETKVVQFFGRYLGTVRTPGLRVTVPLSQRTKVVVRVHNFETNDLKVNDSDGNPINIASIVVWQVEDTAKATFAVVDAKDFVEVQAEAALRHVAMSHPYDAGDEETSLRGNPQVISEALAIEVAERVMIAGVQIVEARISSLAYAPEIAQAMLQRQQAAAIIAAREKIVDGAVGMVENALAKLESHSIVELDDERKAAMVSNLMVVLCSERGTTPVVNAGGLYS